MTSTLNKFTFSDNFLDVKMEYAPVTRSMVRFTGNNQTITVLQPAAGEGPVRIDNLTLSMVNDSYAYGFQLYVKNTDTNHITYLIRNMFVAENTAVTLIDKSNPLWLNDDNMILMAYIQSVEQFATAFPTISFSSTKFEK